MSKPYPIMNGAVPTEPDRQPNLTADQAAFWGVPQNVEGWRFEVHIATFQPVLFAKLLMEANAEQLSQSYQDLSEVLLRASYDIERFVPIDRADVFLDLITNVRQRILVAAARRGLNLCNHQDSIGDLIVH